MSATRTVLDEIKHTAFKPSGPEPESTAWLRYGTSGSSSVEPPPCLWPIDRTSNAGLLSGAIGLDGPREPILQSIPQNNFASSSLATGAERPEKDAGSDTQWLQTMTHQIAQLSEIIANLQRQDSRRQPERPLTHYEKSQGEVRRENLNVTAKEWNPEDAGFFDPGYEGSCSSGPVENNGENVFYGDVYAFIDWLTDMLLIGGLDKLCTVLPQAFRGSALIWLSTEVSKEVKQYLLREGTLGQCKKKLIDCFKEYIPIAVAKLQSAKYTVNYPEMRCWKAKQMERDEAFECREFQATFSSSNQLHEHVANCHTRPAEASRASKTSPATPTSPAPIPFTIPKPSYAEMRAGRTPSPPPVTPTLSATPTSGYVKIAADTPPTPPASNPSTTPNPGYREKSSNTPLNPSSSTSSTAPKLSYAAVAKSRKTTLSAPHTRTKRKKSAPPPIPRHSKPKACNKLAYMTMEDLFRKFAGKAPPPPLLPALHPHDLLPKPHFSTPTPCEQVKKISSKSYDSTPTPYQQVKKTSPTSYDSTTTLLQHVENRSRTKTQRKRSLIA